MHIVNIIDSILLISFINDVGSLDHKNINIICICHVLYDSSKNRHLLKMKLV